MPSSPPLRGLVEFVDEQLPQIDTRVQQLHDPEGDGWAGAAADEHARATSSGLEVRPRCAAGWLACRR